MLKSSPTCPSPSTGDPLLQASVLQRLQSSGYAPLRRLRCQVADGVVSVYGQVPTFHLKQLAQTLILRLHGIRSVENLIEVRINKQSIHRLHTEKKPKEEATRR